MSMTKRILLAALCLAAAAGGLEARNVFVMPGLGGQTVSIFGSDPLGTPASVSGAPASFLALARPDGARYYLLASGVPDSLQILDANFNVLARKSLGDTVRTAMITPDGRRLVVLTVTLRVFDTETGNEIIPPSAPDIGAVAVDLAISQDSRRAFVLSPSAQRVVAVDLTSPSLPVVGSVFLGGGEYAGIAVGPNGLVYASLTNQVVVIDGATMTRLDPAFGANGLPGKLVFTPDGQRAIAVNRLIVTGASAFVFDLLNRTTATVPAMGQTLEDLVVAGNNRAFGVSNGQLLYDIAISPPSIAQATFAGYGSFSAVTGIAVSDELPAARFLYVASSNSVLRADLSNNIESGRVILGTPTGRVSFAGPASAGPPVSGLGYNASQNVPPGAALLPLIARFLDVNGRPVSGAAVTWTSSSADVVFTARGATTTTQGFVQAAVTAPSTLGTYTVEAASGSAKVQFGVLVTPGGGGGGAVTPGGGGIFIVSGNGQLVPEQALSGEAMVVIVKNPDGTPAAGQQVTFEVTQGPVSLSNTTDYTCAAGCVTGADGKAGTGFTSSNIGGMSSYAEAIVTARLANGVSVPFNIIVYLRFRPDGTPALEPQVEMITPAVGQILRGAVGTTQRGAIQARVVAGGFLDIGRPIPNVGMTATTGLAAGDGPTVTCQPNLLSDSTGLLSCDLTFGGKLGQADMTINIGSNRSFRRVVEVTVGEPANIRVLQGANQSGDAGQKLPFPVYVIVSDAGGNVLAGAPVTWEVVQPGTLVLNNVRNTTDANGRAWAEVTLGQTPGVVVLRVKSGTATIPITFTVNVRISRLVKTGGDGQEAVINQAFAQPVAVQVLDDQDRPLPNIPVVFSVLSGTASVNPASVTTDANGRAAATVTAGAQAGAIQIRATASTLSQTFTLTAKLPAPVVVPRDFRNAASGEPGVTPGGITIIRGAGIASGIQGLQIASLTLNQLPTQFLGVEVQFGGVSAPIFWVSNQGGVEEIAVQVPFEVPVGKSTVLIRSATGGSSSVADVNVLPVQPGIFETVIGGRRFAVATRPDGSFIGPDNPAVRGEIIRFYAVGLGQTTPATGTNRAGVPGQAVLAPMIAGLNDAGVRIVSAEYLQGSIGVYVVAIEVPATTAAGPAQSLGFAVQGPDGNMVYANGSQIPIR
jgi:uncharacterized protein (TIGR03437 family)